MSERDERSSYQGSYIGGKDEILIALKSLKKIMNMITFYNLKNV